MVEVRGGRIHDTIMLTADHFGFYFLNGWGTVAYIFPTDTVTVGLGGFTPHATDGRTFGGEPNNWEDGTFNLWGGLRVNVPGTVDLRTQLQHNDKATNALLFARLPIISEVPIDIIARFLNLNDFGDTGIFDAHLYAGLNFVENLGITVATSFGINNGQSAEDPYEDPYMAFGGWFTYALDNIIPRLELWYVSGGQYNYGIGFNQIASVVNYTGTRNWNSNMSYINIRPSVQFRASSAAWLELGGVFNVDIGDTKLPTSSTDQGLTWGAFVTVRSSF
jgi:hypothetical protein